ncbi:conserved Plasmodium protein, unknown function [Plasmodium malariae]|uniref:Uncharacterized protein n=1 Tax=Plasmodium malariae TaxID=5858 RepID=A0A1D3SP42_PLAMA|nr:conserved Plasmodium protein, unknown function [Plasmodium malariae]SCO93165.1 conserved Plasmodium protein, unknown function [Plasmodium malariae]
MSSNVLFFYLSIISYLFVASLCYQIIYVDSYEEDQAYEIKEIDSCSWRYFCHKEFNYCEQGCSSKKKLTRGYNLLNTSDLKKQCFVNIECEHYDIYFDSEDTVYFNFFSKIFFRINTDFTLYVHLRKRTANSRKKELSNSNEETSHWDKKNKMVVLIEKIIQYRHFISKNFKKSLIKLLIFLILIHMIFCYLYVYTYLHQKKYDESM